MPPACVRGAPKEPATAARSQAQLRLEDLRRYTSLLQTETWLSLSIQSNAVHRIGTAARNAILSH